MKRSCRVWLALTLSALPASAQAAEILLSGASATNVTAIIAPDAVDVGSTVNVWMGAVYRGTLYMRNGSQWGAQASGSLPVAFSTRLSASTPVTVVDQIDISGLVGLDLYVGYGSSEPDMLASPGKMSKIYTVPPPTSNVVPLTVDSGPFGLVQSDLNRPFISVTVCSPGSAANCQTIDHIQVDTGSTGLRLISSVVTASLVLPNLRDASGAPIADCVQFADGTAVWGSVRTADIRIADAKASSASIQIIGDSLFPTIPTACGGLPVNTVQSFGANGIIGLGYFREDCGSHCATHVTNGQYYACPASGCVGTAMPLAQQVAHPVALFAGDNNGVIIQLPAIPASGAANVTGSLILGIGTRSNNALGAAKVLTVDPLYGFMTTIFRNSSYFDSVVDSGSTALFLPPGSGIPSCSRRDPLAAGFLCPSTTQNLSAINQGTNNATDAVNFSVANARTLLLNSPLSALNNIAATNAYPYGFTWGLPFFYGRNVFTAIENANTPGGVGPYVAY